MAWGLLRVGVRQCTRAFQGKGTDSDVTRLIRLLALRTYSVAIEGIVTRAAFDTDAVCLAHLQQVLDVRVGVLQHQVTDIDAPVSPARDVFLERLLRCTRLLYQVALVRDVVALHGCKGHKLIILHPSYQYVVSYRCHICLFLILHSSLLTLHLFKECQFSASCAPAPAVGHQSDVLAPQHSHHATRTTATAFL